MLNKKTSIERMRERITDEIFYAFGLKRDGLLRRKFGHWFYRSTQRFSDMFARADELTPQEGLRGASRAILSDLSVKVEASASNYLLTDGPLLVVANHPGAYDSVALASCIPRQDLSIIAYETQFYHTLPNISRRMIMVPADPPGRMLALRRAIQHLLQGKSVLQFGSGRIEPDPAVASGAENWFEKWSPSLEVMLRKAPETRLVLAIASGVLLSRFANHPLTYLRRGAIERRRLAEFMQVIYHLLRPGALDINVRLNFSSPVTLKELESEGQGRRLMPAILERAHDLMAQHIQQYYSPNLGQF